MEKGKIILLSGVSSAGKTTLTKAIQSKLSVPYYHICCDDFMNMTPKHILQADFDNQLLITQGIMHEVIRLFSDKGHCVVVDDVILDLPDKEDWLRDYAVGLDGYPVLFVHVECPLAELVRRQTVRGDRHPDQAQWQMEHVHRDIPYDLSVNTHEESMDRCAERIIAMLDKPGAWSALRTIKERIKSERE